MLADLIKETLSNEKVKVKDRILISCSYIDIDGNEVENISNAYKLTITAKYDLYSKILGEPITDPKPFGEADKVEQSLYGTKIDSSVFGYTLKDKEFGLFSDRIISMMVRGPKHFKLKIDPTGSNTQVFDISENVFAKAFNLYSDIEFDFPAKSGDTRANFPSGNFTLISFSMKGGQISFKDGTTVTTTKDISLTSMLVTTREESPIVTFMSPKSTLADVIFMLPVHLQISPDSSIDTKEFAKTEATISMLSYLTSSLSQKSPETITGIWDRALLSIERVNSVKVNGVKIDGYPYYKGLLFSQCTSVNISEVKRVEERCRTYFIGLNAPNEVYISDIECSNEMADEINGTREFNPIIGLDQPMFRSRISISTFDLKRCDLINISDMNLRSLTVSSGTVTDCTGFIKSKNSNANDMNITGVEINSAKDVDLFCNNSLFLDRSKVFLEDNVNLILGSNENILVDGCQIACTKMTVNAERQCRANIDNCNLSVNEFETGHAELSDGEVFVYKEHLNNFSMNNSVLKVFDKLTLKDVLNADLNGVVINYISEFRLESLNKVTIQTHLDCSGKTPKIYIDSVNSGTADFDLKKISADFSFECKDSVLGSIGVDFSDMYEGEAKSVNGQIKFDNSAIRNFSIDSLRNKVTANLISNDSLGSMVFGTSSNVKVVADLKSTDRQYLEPITELDYPSDDRVYYGSVEE